MRRERKRGLRIAGKKGGGEGSEREKGRMRSRREEAGGRVALKSERGFDRETEKGSRSRGGSGRK